MLWDLATRKRRLAQDHPRQERRSLSVTFRPDSKTIAASYALRAADWGGVVVWDVDIDSWKRRALRIANRSFTRAEWSDCFHDIPYQSAFPELPLRPE